MSTLNRRELLGLAAAAALPTVQVPTGPIGHKVKLGVVGCGGRGGWIAGLFKQHGGYEMHAVADYFPEVAAACGNALGVDSARRFSGLAGYRRLIESGVEAVALETPPYFFPEHAFAAASAGLNVYMAKPVAVDVPGCKHVEEAAKVATGKGRVFLIDYQMPTDAHNIEVVRQVHAGAVGKPVVYSSFYLAGPFADPPLGSTVEGRLQHLIWVNDVGLGGCYHVNACIHAIDAALWLAGSVPVAAMGVSRVGRATPHGDSHDAFALTFELPDGGVIQHRGKHLSDQYTAEYCGVTVHGQSGYAQIQYNGKATLVNGSTAYKEDVANLYEAGARRNIASFYRAVVDGDHSNATVRRAIDSALSTILGREAGVRRTRLSMAQLLRENRRIAVDLTGLKA